MPSDLLTGKRILVTGVVTRSSIAYHVAERAQQLGAGPVADAACFLLSDFSSAITGELLHVDGGFHAMGAPSGRQEAADRELVGATTSPDEPR